MRTRAELLEYLGRLGEHACCYAGKPWPDRTCDCKYGGPVHGLSEQTGCPELRDLYGLVANLRDEEVDAAHARGLARVAAALEETPASLTATQLQSKERGRDTNQT